MKKTTYLLIAYFIIIALLSLLTCFPHLFILENDMGDLIKNWLNIFLYSSAIAQIKIELGIFLNIFGLNSNFTEHFFSVAISGIFLIASFVFFGNKSKLIIRILKFGVVLAGYNAFVNALLFCFLFFELPKFDFLFGQIDSINKSIYLIISILINSITVYLSILFFKQLNTIKFNHASKEAQLNVEESIFEGIETKKAVFTEASVGKRFFNYFIDYLIMLPFIFKIALYYIVFFNLQFEMENPFSKTLLYFSALIAFLFYYFFTEKLYSVTLGKIVTNTRVVQEDGNYITLKQAFIRTISRIVPFEWISAFKGYPWHDQWSNTFVVNEDVEFEHDINQQNTEVMNSNQ